MRKLLISTYVLQVILVPVIGITAYYAWDDWPNIISIINGVLTVVNIVNFGYQFKIRASVRATERREIIFMKENML